MEKTNTNESADESTLSETTDSHQQARETIFAITDVSEGSNSISTKRKRSGRRILLICVLIAIIALLLVLIDNIPAVNAVLPSGNATVTITPANQQQSGRFKVSAVTGVPDASQNQVQARILSYTASEQETVEASGGKRSLYAVGNLTFSQATAHIDIPKGITISGQSRVEITLQESVSLDPGQVVIVPAEASNPGTQGNIPAYDINGDYAVDIGPGFQTGNCPPCFIVQNTSSFTGGGDPSHYQSLVQDDITNVTNSLAQVLTNDIESGLASQAKPNEEVISGGITCQPPHITSNHKVNDIAADITAKGTETCTLEAFDVKGAMLLGVALLKRQATLHLGTSYVQLSQLAASLAGLDILDKKGTLSLSIDVQGKWVYQFSSTQKQNLATIISGKLQKDALTLILKQKGVVKASISVVGGIGNALPLSPSAIQFIVLSAL